jgi:DNA-binding phage protein
MSRSVSYHEDLIKSLKNPLEAASYIEVALEEGDPKIIWKAVNNVIEAKGGLEYLPSSIQEHYGKIDQLLSKKGEIEFLSLTAILDALGLQILVMVKPG